MTDAERAIYKSSQKNMRENLEVASSEYKAFNEVQKTLKMKEIAMAIPTTVTKAYESGLSPPGPFAMFRAVAYAAVALAAQTAQLNKIKKAQVGFSGMVSQPTMFLAGENGAENVNVTPLNAPNIRGPQGQSQNVNISFSGNVMDEDYISEHADPMIRDALRRGETLD